MNWEIWCLGGWGGLGPAGRQPASSAFRATSRRIDQSGEPQQKKNKSKWLKKLHVEYETMKHRNKSKKMWHLPVVAHSPLWTLQSTEMKARIRVVQSSSFTSQLRGRKYKPKGYFKCKMQLSSSQPPPTPIPCRIQGSGIRTAETREQRSWSQKKGRSCL